MRTLFGSNQAAKSNRSRVRWWILFLFAAGFLLAVERSHTGRSVAGRCAVVSLNISVLRPLVSLDFCATVLDVTPETARGLIESGDLLFAWDFARKEGSRHPLIRVFAQSVKDRIEGKPASTAVPDIGAVLNQIFPNQTKTITTFQLSRKWGVDAEHVITLWRAGLLRAAKGAVCKRGRGGSAAIEFASVASFMEKRWLC